MGTDFECGCRLSGSWFLCEKHEIKLIAILDEADLKKSVVRRKSIREELLKDC